MVDSNTRRRPAPPTKRLAYYFYGYDPRANRFYRSLFGGHIRRFLTAEEDPGKVETRRIGRDILITVRPENSDTLVETDLMVPDWHDFVKASLVTQKAHLAWHYHRVLFKAIATGTLFRWWSIWWKLTAVSWVFMLVPLLALPAGVATGLLMPPELGWGYRSLGGTIAAAGWLIGSWAWILRDRFRRFLIWAICFVCDFGGLSSRLESLHCEYDALIEANAQKIRDEIAEGERRDVLVIGHSIGVILAISVVAKLIESDPALLARCRLRLVTLGGCWPFLASQCGLQARRHREAITTILQCRQVDWYDIVAWEDVLGVPDANTNLTKIMGDHPLPKRPIRTVDPVYPETFERVFYEKNKRNFALMHFQYLERPQRPSGFDFYRLLLTRWDKIDPKGKLG